MAILSKSNYLAGLQCPKLVWVKINDKKRLPPVDESKQAIFDSGNVVGEFAKTLFPTGIDIPVENFKLNLDLTQEYLKEKVPLFEPALLVNKLYSRADILKPNHDGSWDIYEVKSSTKVKDINIHDVSFQKYVYKLAGLKIKKCFLVHINNQYVKQGDINPHQLFHKTDITTEVKEFEVGIEKRIEKILEILENPEPEIEIGCHCNEPYSCDLKEECWQSFNGNIFELYMGGNKCFEFLLQGIKNVEEIPLNYKLNTKQLIQKQCLITQEPFVSKAKIKEFLDKLKYPLYFLDFETINPAIPKFDGMRPYQRIPFQYSLHIQETPNSKLKHISFLNKNSFDPRKDFLESLKQNLGEKGSIVVYNQAFEKGVLKENVEIFQEYKNWFNKILPRVIDLLEPFKNFQFHSSKQKGSCSIKAILPLFSELDYHELEIQNGAQANVYYERATFSEIEKKEKDKIYQNLETYCHQDTLAEVKIIEGLKELVK